MLAFSDQSFWLSCSVGNELVDIDPQGVGDTDSIDWIGTEEMADLAQLFVNARYRLSRIVDRLER
jgi:hypothetical protein